MHKIDKNNRRFRNNHSSSLIFSILLVLSMVVLYSFEQAIAATITPINPNDFSTYSDPISRIKIRYPSDWIGSQGTISHSIDRTKFNLLINDVNFKPIDESVGVTVTSFN